MPAQESSPVSTADLKAIFAGLELFPSLVLAVSGGPDSTALMVLAARWRKMLKTKPRLVAVTVDHGLRVESRREAADVARLARALGITHRVVRWGGKKPKSGLQEMARLARYRLLAEVARKAKASHILTAHTRDDQAETVLIRMSRGSGLGGLAGMARIGALPTDGHGPIKLARPLLDVPKARLVATLRTAKIRYADDPSNRDPRFTRTRLRGLAEQLAREGLDSRRLALLARRLKRADQAIEAVVERAEIELTQLSRLGVVGIDAAAYGGLPAEIGLRLLGRLLGRLGHEGPVELGKLEALKAALDVAQNTAGRRFRRSLAGAIVTLAAGLITIEGAPPRRGKALTTRRSGKAKLTEARYNK